MRHVQQHHWGANKLTAIYPLRLRTFVVHEPLAKGASMHLDGSLLETLQALHVQVWPDIVNLAMQRKVAAVAHIDEGAMEAGGRTCWHTRDSCKAVMLQFMQGQIKIVCTASSVSGSSRVRICTFMSSTRMWVMRSTALGSQNLMVAGLLGIHEVGKPGFRS